MTPKELTPRSACFTTSASGRIRVLSRMTKNHDKHHLRIAHTVGLIAMRPILLSSGEHMIFLIFCKFLTEIACQTINFSNFSLGEYSGNDLNVITEYRNSRYLTVTNNILVMLSKKYFFQ